jgi:hypothetical protein
MRVRRSNAVKRLTARARRPFQIRSVANLVALRYPRSRNHRCNNGTRSFHSPGLASTTSQRRRRDRNTASSSGIGKASKRRKPTSHAQSASVDSPLSNCRSTVSPAVTALAMASSYCTRPVGGKISDKLSGASGRSRSGQTARTGSATIASQPSKLAEAMGDSQSPNSEPFSSSGQGFFGEI